LPLTLEDTINVDRRLPELIDVIRTIGDQPAIGDMESSVVEAGSLYRAARLIINLRWTGDAPPAVMIGRFQFQLDSHRRDPHCPISSWLGSCSSAGWFWWAVNLNLSRCRCRKGLAFRHLSKRCQKIINH